eukprot:Platyproteum_vivax@DN5452_c0_g1_i1.p1
MYFFEDSSSDTEPLTDSASRSRSQSCERFSCEESRYKKKRKPNTDSFGSPRCVGEVPRVIRSLTKLVEMERNLVKLEKILCARQAALDIREEQMDERLQETETALLQDVDVKERALKEIEEEIEKKQQALAAEKEKMTNMKAKQSDILLLNLGGEKTVEVSRSTMCAVEGSFLEAMFSGRWDEQLARDQRGAVFINYSPVVFLPIIDWLRAKQDAHAAHIVPAPIVPQSPELCAQYLNLVEKFGLGELIPANHNFSNRPKLCRICQCESGERVNKVIIGGQVRLGPNLSGEEGTITGSYRDRVLVTWNRSGHIASYRIRPQAKSRLHWA